MVEWLMNNEQERIWKEMVAALLSYYPDVTWRGWRKRGRLQ
jgi:hypothetical protein